MAVFVFRVFTDITICYKMVKIVRGETMKVVDVEKLKELFGEKIDSLPTIEITRCKECKHWGTGVAGETEYVKCCDYGKYMVGENGYCVYGMGK